jgi:hypothetical protein
MGGKSKNMKTGNLERGFYFRIFKQDVLKKDLWIEDAVVFSRDAFSAAELFVEIHCPEKDHIHSIKEICFEEFDLIIKGEHNYEGKYKIKLHPELDIEIPAFLRN